MKLHQKGFGAVEILLVIIALTLIVGVGFYVFNTNKDDANTQTEQKISTANENKPAETKKQYLEFKNAGVKIELNETTKDAYNGSTSDDELFIGSHAIDSQLGFENCKVDGPASGITALAYAKAGDDNFGSPWTEAELQEVGEAKIGDTYYWFASGGAPCWNPDEISDSSPQVQKLLDFKNALSLDHITKL